MLTTILALIIVLGVLIFIHEAGHFLAAKWAGIYVHRFSLGLGSPIPWLTFRRGETEYSDLLAAARRVREDGEPGGGGDQLGAGGRARRGGGAARTGCSRPSRYGSGWSSSWRASTMNALFAWLAFTFLAAKNGRQIDPSTTVGRAIEEMVPAGAEALRGDSDRRPGSPASTAGRWPRGTTSSTVSRTRPSPRSGSSWRAARRWCCRSIRMRWRSGSRRPRRFSRSGRR